MLFPMPRASLNDRFSVYFNSLSRKKSKIQS
jgi:hypothetical protein